LDDSLIDSLITTDHIYTANTELSMTKGETSRLQFIQQSVAAAAALTILPGNAFAAKYGSFGAGSPEVIDPKEAIVDEEILKSAPVQKAFEAVKTYKAATESMKSELQKNSQADIGPIIRKQFDFVQLRNDLNTLNTAFDEDTQRGTDRVIRLIMQDITELETANKQKEGISRSEKRLQIMFGKLEKLEKAFGDFLAFV
jgi:Fe-S-cluster formation regulator IscX/YfhJ